MLRHLPQAILWPLRWLLYRRGLRFLRLNTRRIGHLATELDCYLKEGLLGLRPRWSEIVLAPVHKETNRHLLGYWRRHVRILSSPLMCHLLAPLYKNSELQIETDRYLVPINETPAYPSIQAAYGDRPPLLSLTESDRERGRDCLRRLGVPDNAWFVCFHCRESGYAPNPIFDYRDGDINNYLAAVSSIVERGGWCLRMGDPTMKPLPAMERVIDYAHLDVRCDWMDVFLCAGCRFFLGNSSGLYLVASVFGVPCAVANQAPMSAVLAYAPRDISIPKLVWSLHEGRYLTFKEVLDSPVGSYFFSHLYEESGLRVEESSPEDIRDLALEMLDSTEGKMGYTEEDERLQNSFRSLLKPGHYSYGSPSRVGRDFLQKHNILLTES